MKVESWSNEVPWSALTVFSESVTIVPLLRCVKGGVDLSAMIWSKSRSIAWISAVLFSWMSGR